MFILPEYVKRLRDDLRQKVIAHETVKRAHLSQKKKSENLEDENKRLKKENNYLKKENEELKQEIEKLTKTNERYRVALFDHGNFKNPETTFMVIMHLRFKGKQSIRTIAVTLNSLFGLSITKSGILNLLFQAKEYLDEKYEDLKRAVRNGDVMVNA
jgi:DNA repair exonuclease SbcCD ATPase subunit